LETTEVARAVFSYFRWKGWLDERQALHERIVQATGLAGRFSDEPKSFTDDDLVTHAVPAWIRGELSVTPAFARALQKEPTLWLRARPGQGRQLAGRLGKCRSFGSVPLADALAYSGTEDLFLTPEFHRGEFEVQDISSQAVGLVCAPSQGETWWDACAGEGGKLLHLSDLKSNKGLIWASDRAEWRLRRLKRRAARARVFNYRAALWDGGARLPTKGKFDGVLVDAPCTGIGTWQRNPHARWTLLPSDLEEMNKVQVELLTNAAKAVKPGGKLIYSVCSLARFETAEVVHRFQDLNPDFTALQIKNPLTEREASNSTISLWPQDFGGNGMFIAGWVRS
jgi:16S rRNA (cytosine967-C5)-methyltransferase